MNVEHWMLAMRELLDLDPEACALDCDAHCMTWLCRTVTGTYDTRRPRLERWQSPIGTGPSAAHVVGDL